MLSPTCHDGLLTLRDAAGRVLIADAYARAVLADGTWYTTHGGQVRHEGAVAIVEAWPIARTVRPDGAVGLRWRIEAGPDGLTLTLAVALAEGADAVAVDRLDVLVAPTGVPAEAELAQTGYQSWSHATPVAPISHQRDAMPPIAAPPLPPADGVQVPWMTLVQPLGLLAGFTTEPDVVLLGRETIYRDDARVGWLASGGYGYTLGRSIGYGYVRDPAGVDRDHVLAGRYELEVAGERVPAEVFLDPPYDPKDERVRR